MVLLTLPYYNVDMRQLGYASDNQNPTPKATHLTSVSLMMLQQSLNPATDGISLHSLLHLVPLPCPHMQALDCMNLIYPPPEAPYLADKTSRANWAAFSPDKSMPPKIGPILGEPKTALAAMPATIRPG